MASTIQKKSHFIALIKVDHKHFRGMSAYLGLLRSFGRGCTCWPGSYNSVAPTAGHAH